MQRWILSFVAACAVLVAYAETETVDGVRWTYLISDGKAEIVYMIPTSTSGEITIPSKLGGCSVTSIGAQAFEDCNGLTSVTIPSSVTSIKYGAFTGCEALTSVTIGNGVTSIGEYAFEDCSSLTSVTIPDSVMSIGEHAFFNCGSLYDTNSIPGVRLVDGWAVDYTDLLPDNLNLMGVRGIGDSAFDYCRWLASVTMSDSVTSIGRYAFVGCRNLMSVRMPKIPIDDSVFQGCSEDLAITYYYWETVLTLRSNSTKYGTVAGGGNYVFGTSVTIKATAKKGYAFVGWFTDKACTKALNPEGCDNRNSKVRIVMPADATTIYAKFVTADADKKALKFSSATKKFAKTPVKATAGKAFLLELGISSASLPKVTAKGLPEGLSIDKTTGVISGIPVSVGSYTATVTVKNAAGNTITQKVKITISSIVSWAKGTFYGWACLDETGSEAYLQFSVDAKGKVSGKLKHKDKWYSFKSAYFYFTETEAMFEPEVKIGSSTFKPGIVIVEKSEYKNGDEFYEYVDAVSRDGNMWAQKKAGLVKKGKAFAALVGKKFTLTYKNAELRSSKDKLVIVISNGDSVKASGVLDGKKLTAISLPLWVYQTWGMYFYTSILDVKAYRLDIDFDVSRDRTGAITEVKVVARAFPHGVNRVPLGSSW